MVTIDVHAHVLPQAAVRAGEEGRDWHGTRVERGANGRPVLVTGSYRVGMGSTEIWQPPETRLPHMDAERVDVQILSLNPILFRYYLDRQPAIAAAKDVNEEIADVVARVPQRFGGFATLPLQDPDASIKELERAVNELGLVGAAIGTHVNGRNWDEPELFGVLEAASDLGALLFMHPSASRIKEEVPRYHMRNYIANPLETTIAIGSLIFGGVLDRLPDLKLCCAHGGGYACWASARFDHGYKVRPEAREFATGLPSEYVRRLYVDSLVHSYRNLQQLVDVLGEDRVVMGTDYPADMGQPDPVTWIEGSGLPAEQQQAILGGNLQNLLGERLARSRV